MRWKDINFADDIITLTAYKGKGRNIKPKRWPVQMTTRLKKELLQLQLQRKNKNDAALVFEHAKVNLRKLWTAAYAEAAVPKGTRYSTLCVTTSVLKWLMKACRYQRLLIC